MKRHDEKYSMTVYSSDLEIADKFYEQLIGLKLKRKSKKEILLKGDNYDVLIKKQ